MIETNKRKKICLASCRCRGAGLSSLLPLDRPLDRAAHIIRRLARLESEDIVFEAVKRAEESEKKERSSKQVEHAVENHLAVYRDHIAALREAPADWVKKPDERDVARAETIHGLCRKEARPESGIEQRKSIGRERGSANELMPMEERAQVVCADSHDVEERQNAKNEEAPLVGRRGEPADEPHDYCDDDHEDN